MRPGFYPYITVRHGQSLELPTFSPLSSEENRLYRLSGDNLKASIKYSEINLAVFDSLGCSRDLPCMGSEYGIRYLSMKRKGGSSRFGIPSGDLPHRTDQFCCSNWYAAGQFIEKSELPADRFEWSMEINEDTGLWLIHGHVSPTFKEQLIGKWLRSKMKSKLLFRRVRRNIW